MVPLPSTRRVRRSLSPNGRRMAAALRKVGVCEKHRLSKTKCRHPSLEPVPTFESTESSASASSQLGLTVERFQALVKDSNTTMVDVPDVPSPRNVHLESMLSGHTLPTTSSVFDMNELTASGFYLEIEEYMTAPLASNVNESFALVYNSAFDSMTSAAPVSSINDPAALGFNPEFDPYTHTTHASNINDLATFGTYPLVEPYISATPALAMSELNIDEPGFTPTFDSYLNATPTLNMDEFNIDETIFNPVLNPYTPMTSATNANTNTNITIPFDNNPLFGPSHTHHLNGKQVSTYPQAYPTLTNTHQTFP